MSSMPAHDDVYLIQHYVIKLVSDLWQVSGFLQLYTDCHNITEKLWTVALISHILHTVTFKYCYILTECRTASQHSLVIQSVFTAGSLFYTRLMPIKQRLVCTCKFSQKIWWGISVHFKTLLIMMLLERNANR
jgi:hypothetical protein